jgi:hypothetical protein
MPSIIASTATYEDWLRAHLGAELVEADIAAKHARMRESAFLFLRATCWRWAELAPALCPDLVGEAMVRTPGDAHVGNFGLWRDAEGRLCWGMNDFDEAARIAWPLDLVRLGASALLADGDGISAEAVGDAILAGYSKALQNPLPYVLERDHLWLRDTFAADDKMRSAFWSKLEAAPEADDVTVGIRAALQKDMPPSCGPVRLAWRQAGVGSLGRPRFVALAEMGGAPVAREAKRLVPSCWAPDSAAGADFDISRGRWRASDPFLHRHGDIAIRRLAPNSRKLEIDQMKGALLVRVLDAMGRDLGAIHADDASVASLVATDLARRPKHWLSTAIATVAAAAQKDWHKWRDSGPQ